MNAIEFFAGIAYLITDVLAVISLVGAVIIVITAFIEASTKKRIQLPNQIVTWGFGGVIFGFIGFFLLLMSDYLGKPIGVVFKLSFGTVGFLLVISLILLIVRSVIRPQVK